MTKWGLRLCEAAVILSTCIVYWPGLFGGFVFDDQVNILENEKLQVTELTWNQLFSAATSINSGPLGRPLSMLSFAINILTTGLSPFYFKLTNLFIHLLVGSSLYWLTRLLLTSPSVVSRTDAESAKVEWVALAVAAAWILHPFNLTGVLYIVQRMTSLSALFCIWGIIVYVIARIRIHQGRPGCALLAVSLVVFLPLSILSKENGAILPLFLLLLEWLLFRSNAENLTARDSIRNFHLVFTIVPTVGAIGLLAVKFDWLLGGYATRDFVLSERLMTEARVIWFYLFQILLPNVGQMGLYHDDISVSRGLFQPLTTLPSIVALILLAASAITMRKVASIYSFGVLFFLVGHVIESSIVPLEIAHEHRNYLPSYGLVLSLIYYLFHPPVRFVTYANIGRALAGGLVLVFGISTAARAGHWGNDLIRAELDVKHHPQSPRSRIELAYDYVLFSDYAKEPKRYLQAAREQYIEAMRYDCCALTAQFAVLAMDSKANRHEPDLFSGLVTRLSKDPLASASINALIKLSQCSTQGICHIDPQMLWMLLESALANSTLRPFPRSQILTEMTQQLVSRNEVDRASIYAEKAVSNFPDDAQLHLNYANILIALNQPIKARDELIRARDLDGNGFYARKIKIQEGLLNGVIE